MLLLLHLCKELIWVEETIEKWVVFSPAVSDKCGAGAVAKFFPKKVSFTLITLSERSLRVLLLYYHCLGLTFKYIFAIFKYILSITLYVFKHE